MNSIVIKGNKYGLIIYVDEELSFKEAKEGIVSKLKECEKFYKGAALGLTFEGKKFTEAEEREIILQISEKTEINIICIMDNDSVRETKFKKTLEEHLSEMDSSSGQFYKGTLRSGQVIESDSSIVVLGDINPGAKVIAAGNIVVLGALKGNVYAGASGNESAFVVALDMAPTQIRICNVVGHLADSNTKKRKTGVTQIAYLVDDNIYVEPLNKDVIGDIKNK